MIHFKDLSGYGENVGVLGEIQEEFGLCILQITVYLLFPSYEINLVSLN